MTEAEWDTCADPRSMLEFLCDNRRASDRRLRLFACACWRPVWNLLPEWGRRQAVEVAERYAEQVGTKAELDEHRRRAQGEATSARKSGRKAATGWACQAAAVACYDVIAPGAFGASWYAAN